MIDDGHDISMKRWSVGMKSISGSTCWEMYARVHTRWSSYTWRLAVWNAWEGPIQIAALCSYEIHHQYISSFCEVLQLNLNYHTSNKSCPENCQIAMCLYRSFLSNKPQPSNLVMMTILAKISKCFLVKQEQRINWRCIG